MGETPAHRHLVAAPLALVGSLTAHQLGYLVVAGGPSEGARLLAHTGHGYLDHLPLILGAVLAAALVGVAVEVSRAWAGRPHAVVPVLPVAMVPPLAFVVQEHLERYTYDGVFPVGAIAEPTFLAGLAFQIPFAILAWLAARLLVRAAPSLAAVLRALQVRPRRRRAGGRARVGDGPEPRVHAIAVACAPVRGPPADARFALLMR